MKGLIFDIYRSADGIDCTNGGQSSRVQHGTLIGQGIPEIFEPTPDAPAFVLVEKHVRGLGLCIHLKPVDAKPGAWLMFGGNFGYSTDGRFPSSSPIAIHDRQE